MPPYIEIKWKLSPEAERDALFTSLGRFTFATVIVLAILLLAKEADKRTASGGKAVANIRDDQPFLSIRGPSVKSVLGNRTSYLTSPEALAQKPQGKLRRTAHPSSPEGNTPICRMTMS
jgi:hypothetical protein